jgi:hypothetical protein
MILRAIFILCVVFSRAVAADLPVAPPPPLDSALIAEAKVHPGVRFDEGWRDPFLVSLAQGYSDQMARMGSQGGHRGWSGRYGEIRRVLNMRGVEVTAESWPWQVNDPPVALARDAFRSWSYSSGHWRVVSTPHRRYGDGLAKSKQGVWFTTIIVAD